METFTIRDLRERTGELVHGAEEGKLSLITKHGQPVFLAVPFSEELLNLGLRNTLAIQMFKEEILSLGKAAKLAGIPIETFMEQLGKLNIPSIHYSSSEVDQEMKDFG